MAKKLKTLGLPSKRTEFLYSGSIHDGVVLHQSGNPRIEAAVFREALKRFAGATLYGGFQEDNPRQGGFGEWLQNESPRLNSRKLTPRHGSFVAAILCAEAGVESSLDGNSVVLQFPDFNKRDNFAFVMNVAEITDAEMYELAPGLVIRRATAQEVAFIKERVKGFGEWFPFLTDLWETNDEDGTVERLPESEWRYFVVEFTGNNEELLELGAAFDIAEPELEIAFAVLYRVLKRNVRSIGIVTVPGRLFQALEHTQRSNFFKVVSTKDLATIAAVNKALATHDERLIPLRHYASQVGELKALPHTSPLLFLGYFAILESLITHQPDDSDPYDSLTRQVQKKVALLNNRWPNPINYAPFGVPADTLWSKMYAYRSTIAHGGIPDLKGKLQILGSHERALQLIKDTVKRTIRYGLDEPQLLVDLRNC